MKDSLKKQIKERLVRVYKSEEKAEAATKLIDERLNGYETAEVVETPLSEKDSILITYGDTITDDKKPGLEVLHQFLNKYVGEAIETVHLLPMYPYTSDDGFSVVDYRQINPELGDWEQIKEMSSDYGLMFDAVINHISKSSEWFEGYLKGEEPYKNYFITCDKDADYSTVTRPRALPLLTKFQTKDGEKYVWTTFSDDQIDLNFECPELLAEILDILVMYGRSGAKFIRLDAIGFMWKELGTTCMHLPETHELIKLMKDVLKVSEAAYGCITVLGIAAGMDEAKTDAAKKFVSFMLEDENNVDWLNMAPGGIQPVIKSVDEMPEYTELEERKAYVHMNEEIANAVANLQLFGAVDGKNFTEMGDVTNTGAISKMVNNVVVQNADVDTELKTAQTAVEGLMK